MHIKTTLLIPAVILGSLTGSQAQSIQIDNFTDGSSFTDQNTSGTATYNYISGAADIIGGSRQVRTRAAGSGFYGPSVIAVDTTAGSMSSYGGDNGDRFLEYGSGIGSQTFTGAGPGTPVNLNEDLNLADAFSIVVANATAGDAMQITVIDSGNNQYNYNFDISSAGTYSVPLSDFSGLTSLAASDIDGFLFNPQSTASTAATGLVVSDLSITTTVPEPSTLALAGLGCAGLLLRFRRK